MADYVPVITNNKVQGVVVNFKDVTQVIEMEKKYALSYQRKAV